MEDRLHSGMVDGEDWWARYCLAGMNEWDYPVDSRKLLNKLFKDDYRKFSKRISLRSMEEMIRRTTHNFVWMPREFHDAAKMDVGFPPVIDGSRNRIRELTKYLSFVEDLDLTTCEGRNIYLLTPRTAYTRPGRDVPLPVERTRLLEAARGESTGLSRIIPFHTRGSYAQ